MPLSGCFVGLLLLLFLILYLDYTSDLQEDDCENFTLLPYHKFSVLLDGGNNADSPPH